MLYGILSFSAVSFDTDKDVPDLSGKVIAITGGNTGLGLETILRLAPHNPLHIYILSRNPTSTSSAISRTQSTLSSKNLPCSPITHIPCDLSSFSSIQSAARTLVSKTTRLDLLFLNAGILCPPPALTNEGYEIQFGTNHLGHFLLTKLLLPLLTTTAQEPDADVRVITLSSIAVASLLWRGIDFSSLKKAGSSWLPASGMRYAQSKLASVLFARELDRRVKEKGVLSVSVHPGIISTTLWKDMFSFAEGWGWFREGVKGMRALVGFQGVEEGVRNALWAATGRRGEGKGEVRSGEFYTPVGVVGQGTWRSEDMELAGRLWEWSEKEVEGYAL